MSLDTPSIRCPSPLYSVWTSQLFDRAFEVSFCLPLYWFSDFESIRGMCEAVAYRAIYQSSAHFTKAWVQGWQRTGECRHHCFHEAGSFHADNVDILSKVLWYCSHGKRFYVFFTVITFTIHHVKTVSPLVLPFPHCLSYPLHFLLPCTHLFSWAYLIKCPSHYYSLPYLLHLKCQNHYSFHLPALKSEISL